MGSSNVPSVGHARRAAMPEGTLTGGMVISRALARHGVRKVFSHRRRLAHLPARRAGARRLRHHEQPPRDRRSRRRRRLCAHHGPRRRRARHRGPGPAQCHHGHRHSLSRRLAGTGAGRAPAGQLDRGRVGVRQPQARAGRHPWSSGRAPCRAPSASRSTWTPPAGARYRAARARWCCSCRRSISPRPWYRISGALQAAPPPVIARPGAGSRCHHRRGAAAHRRPSGRW
jgi:hypothetical protein